MSLTSKVADTQAVAQGRQCSGCGRSAAQGKGSCKSHTGHHLADRRNFDAAATAAPHQLQIETSSAIFVATTASESSDVSRPLREASMGLTSRSSE